MGNRNAPQARRQMEIDAKDERITRINDMARSKAFSVMGTVIFPILVLTLILLRASLAAILPVIGAFIVGWVVYFAYIGKYAKEM